MGPPRLATNTCVKALLPGPVVAVLRRVLMIGGRRCALKLLRQAPPNSDRDEAVRTGILGVGLVLLGLTNGCSLSGTIGDHSIAYNSSVEQATDSLLVMNILRARD